MLYSARSRCGPMVVLLALKASRAKSDLHMIRLELAVREVCQEAERAFRVVGLNLSDATSLKLNGATERTLAGSSDRRASVLRLHIGRCGHEHKWTLGIAEGSLGARRLSPDTRLAPSAASTWPGARPLPAQVKHERARIRRCHAAEAET